MSEEPQTHELREEQMRREADEQIRAQTSRDEEELAQHERRAEKARYLRTKLEQRADAERKHR